MHTLLENIRREEVGETEGAQRNYRELVLQLARGESPDTAEVREVLQALGKTSADLHGDVGRQQRRDLLHRQMEAGSDAHAEHLGLQEQVAEALRELQAAQQRFTEIAGPLQLRLEQAKQLILAASAAESELRQTCEDQSLLSRHQDIRGQLGEAEHELIHLQDRRESARVELAIEKSKPVPKKENEWRTAGENLGGNPETVARLEAQLQTIDRTIAEAEERRDKLTAETERLSRQMIAA